MLKTRHYSIEEVYTNTYLALHMSFFSAKYDKFIIEDIEKILNDKIFITYTDKNDFTNNYLYKEYDGSKPRYVLKLKYYNYLDIKLKLQYILTYLNNYAEFNFNTQLKAYIKFDYKNLKTLNRVSNLNITKLILSFNENYIWNIYPLVKNSPFAFSIKQCIPYNTYSAITNINNLNNYINYPIEEYYGIDLTQHAYDIISFNYLLGNYCEHIDKTYDVIKYYILKLYTIINSNDFDEEEKDSFKNMQDKYNFANRGFNNPELFLKENPDIKISINLKYDIQSIKTYWNKIKDQIYNLFIVGNIRKGNINYDTDINRCQIKDCTIVDGILDNLDILNCVIDRSIIKNCEIWYSNIDNTRIYKTLFHYTNTIKSSILLDVAIKNTNKIDNCYINNNYQIIEGSIENSIVKYATLSKKAHIDQNTIIIAEKDFDPTIASGIKVDEIRDYNWIKSLTKHD